MSPQPGRAWRRLLVLVSMERLHLIGRRGVAPFHPLPVGHARRSARCARMRLRRV